MGWIADVLTGGANVLDLPGSMVRDMIGGENPLDNIYSKKRGFGAMASGENRLSGREMLAKYGMKPNDPNKWEWQDFAGFGAEVATDPTNWFGGAGLAKLMGRAGRAKASNKASAALRAQGAMPREIAEKSMIKDASGEVPSMMYWGDTASPIPGRVPETSGLHPALLNDPAGFDPTTGMGFDPGTGTGVWSVRPYSERPFSTGKEYSPEVAQEVAENMPGFQTAYQTSFMGKMGNKDDLMMDALGVENQISKRVGGAFDMNSVDADQTLQYLNRPKYTNPDEAPFSIGGDVAIDDARVTSAVQAANDIGVPTGDIVIPGALDPSFNSDIARGRMNLLDPEGMGRPGAGIMNTIEHVGKKRPGFNEKAILPEEAVANTGYDMLVRGTEPSKPTELLDVLAGLNDDKFDNMALEITDAIDASLTPGSKGGGWTIKDIDDVLSGQGSSDNLQALIDDIDAADIDIDSLMAKYMDPSDLPLPDVTPLAAWGKNPSDRGVTMYSGDLPIAEAFQQVPTKGIGILASALTGHNVAARAGNTSGRPPKGFLRDKLVGGVK